MTLSDDEELARALGYRLGPLLGRGATARVYSAADQGGRAVALKLLATADPELGRRFVREGKLATRLRHPHLVSALGVLEHGGRAVLVLELVPAPTLAARVEPSPLDEADALRLLASVGDALAYLHRQAVLHRDVKPSNVLAAPGRFVLCDLGLARAEDFSTALTGTSTVVGTLEYIAPEYVEQRPIGPAADVYSLGATAYHALMGGPPLPAPNPVALAKRILYEEAAPVRRARPELSRDLEALVATLLEKDAAARPAASEVVTTARALLARRG